MLGLDSAISIIQNDSTESKGRVSKELKLHDCFQSAVQKKCERRTTNTFSKEIFLKDFLDPFRIAGADALAWCPSIVQFLRLW